MPSRNSGSVSVADLILVLSELRQAGRPLDAYSLSQLLVPTNAMQVGRCLHELEARGCVSSADPAGTANDLARTFCVVPPARRGRRRPRSLS